MIGIDKILPVPTPARSRKDAFHDLIFFLPYVKYLVSMTQALTLLQWFAYLKEPLISSIPAFSRTDP